MRALLTCPSIDKTDELLPRVLRLARQLVSERAQMDVFAYSMADGVAHELSDVGCGVLSSGGIIELSILAYDVVYVFDYALPATLLKGVHSDDALPRFVFIHQTLTDELFGMLPLASTIDSELSSLSLFSSSKDLETASSFMDSNVNVGMLGETAPILPFDKKANDRIGVSPLARSALLLIDAYWRNSIEAKEGTRLLGDARAEIERQRQHIADMEEGCRRAMEETERVRADNRRLVNDWQKLSADRQNLQVRYDKLRESSAFKLGSAVAKPYRTVRDKVKKGKRV